jgi:4-hydroxybenzoate polyprenyltransferase
MVLPISHLFLYQINKFNPKNPDKCLEIFKSNNFLGLLVFINIFVGKII